MQANLTQSNTNSGTQTNIISHHTPSFPKIRTNNLQSRVTSPQYHLPVNPLNITKSFKSFKCAWCSEEKHDWTQCKQWNSWNLPQKQQALQILDNVKKGKLPPTMSARPNHYHPQQKLPFNLTQVRRNRERFSKVQWEKQVKINENVQKAGLVKISISFYVQQCSTVMKGVESSSLRRSRTTPKSE